MAHQNIQRQAAMAEARSVTEILSDARDLQSRHAPRLLATVASWVRDRLASRVEAQSDLVVRRLVVH